MESMATYDLKVGETGGKWVKLGKSRKNLCETWGSHVKSGPLNSTTSVSDLQLTELIVREAQPSSSSDML